MIQISQLKLPVTHTEKDLKRKIAKTLRVRESEILSFCILKQSLDARKKPELYYVYTVEVTVKSEFQIRNKVKNSNVTFRKKVPAYTCTPTGQRELRHRPVVVGTGPAGLFCGYELARMGYRPILLERGAEVKERVKDVEEFWNTGKLKAESNVQFGEGGAGTFSDGKLNTLVHDETGRGREVLRLFAEHGAPDRILYENKPHIGTDILTRVVENLRTSICRMGGEVRFHAKVVDIQTKESGERAALTSLTVEDTRTRKQELLKTELAVFAIGHSARDTFAMLKNCPLTMMPKSFAVGVRIEHPQSMINDAQYGQGAPKSLPAAAYKLTSRTSEGRGVYTFCMCPGGYVVNASSEEGRIAVNGMSYSGRKGINANSAVIVTVTPDDYGCDDVLSGLEFQRRLEEAAYREGKGKIPVQLLGDFLADRTSDGPGEIIPQIKGAYTWANVRHIFPDEIAQSLLEGIKDFDSKIPGYGRKDAVISGVESRTSSPVRIVRNSELESDIAGLYPCGEGAGYAGGITSAAMDGLKVAEAVSRIYRSFDKDFQP